MGASSVIPLTNSMCGTKNGASQENVIKIDFYLRLLVILSINGLSLWINDPVKKKR
jgi:hypothetical protein